MQTRRVVACLVFVVMLSCGHSLMAQNVFVRSTVENGDFVGNRLVFAFKEQLRKSSTYNLLDEPDGKSLIVAIVTLSVDEHARESATSVVVMLQLTSGGSLVLDHRLLLIGKDRTDEMAESLMADFDKAVSDARTALKEASAPKQTPPAQAHHEPVMPVLAPQPAPK